jgi:hypothetical protein
LNAHFAALTAAAIIASLIETYKTQCYRSAMSPVLSAACSAPKCQRGARAHRRSQSTETEPAAESRPRQAVRYDKSRPIARRGRYYVSLCHAPQDKKSLLQMYIEIC